MNMYRNSERIAFRLKDLLTVIGNKKTVVKVCCYGAEIDYGKIAMYKDFYVVDIAVKEEDDSPTLVISVGKNVQYIYLPDFR